MISKLQCAKKEKYMPTVTFWIVFGLVVGLQRAVIMTLLSDIINTFLYSNTMIGLFTVVFFAQIPKMCYLLFDWINKTTSYSNLRNYTLQDFEMPNYKIYPINLYCGYCRGIAIYSRLICIVLLTRSQKANTVTNS